MSHRIFLTGGTGFLGSHFLSQALAAGHEVLALRRPGSTPRIPLTSEPIWLEGNLHDSWDKELSYCDRFVHLAAAGVSPQKATWEELFRVNVLNSLLLWKKASDAGIRRFVICGSCFEYGSSGSEYSHIPPSAPLLPTNCYGASKAAASIAVLGLAAELKFELIILRPFNMFGEGQHESNFWPMLKRAALSGEDFSMTDGSQIRDFMPVEDVASTFLSAVSCNNLAPGKPRIENVGSGNAQSLLEFAIHWWNHWQAQGQIRPGSIPQRDNEVMRYVPLLPDALKSV